ncbi:DUF2752 domain-containing protein [Flavobacterium restrictum]|uniref:DUF2752 domain-containing protein n=1 Tax=Flavobacterium restrictum TaxID=2594428 RepID=A0A553E796_9FLAO|nr:DUF2752 domain-containing protein [Flavobacterium restrictum]
MLPCLSKTLFGVECLGCGFQRAFVLVIKGDFAAAFQMYPAIYSSLLFFVTLAWYVFDKSTFTKKLLLATGITNGIFMIAGYAFKHFL